MSNEMLIPKGAAGTKIAKTIAEVVKKASTKVAPIENTVKKVGETGKTVEPQISKNLTKSEAETLSKLSEKDFRRMSSEEKSQLRELKIKSLGDFNYTGKQFSYKDIVNQDGTINYEKAYDILKEVESNIPGATSFEKISNKGKRRHEEDNTLNLLSHTLSVGKSAQNLGLTKNFTKQEFVFSALAHDLGKIVTSEEHLHGPVGAILIKQIFPDIPDKVVVAVREHMARNTFQNDLQKALHLADLANGRKTVQEVMERFPSAKPYASTKYIVPKEHRTLSSLASELQVIPREATKGTRYRFSKNPDGSYRFRDINDEGIPLIETQEGELTKYSDYVKQLRRSLEESKTLDKARISEVKGRKFLGDIPIYNSTVVQKIAQKILSNENEIIKLRDAVKAGNKDAAHVLLNLKYASTHNMEGIELLGGGTAGKNILKEFRLTPGQISDIVDQYKLGYKGIVTPVIKGSGNYLGRNKGFTTAKNFGEKLYLTNSPLVALRFSDLRVLKKRESREMLLQGLNPQDKQKAEQIIEDILDFNKKYKIKQGDWDLNIFRTGYRKGSMENLLPSLYEGNQPKLRKLMEKYDELQHLLGNRNLAVGGTRRGIALINPNVVTTNYGRKTYKGHLSKQHPLYPYFKGGDHNLWTTFLQQLNIQQGVTSNIGETLKKALDKGAPYGVDLMVRPQDFIVSRWKEGGKLDSIKQFKQEDLIDSLNEPKTWEEYQKLNRKKL